MKYVIISLILTMLCFGTGFLIERTVHRKVEKKNKLITVLSTIFTGIMVLTVALVIFFNIHYSPGEKALSALEGSAAVSVEKISGGYLFDGPSQSKAIVFYPGARIECECYAPLMLKLAENGIDCFLADMPLNFPLFGKTQALSFMENYSYDYWILGGHSLGGVAAVKLVTDNSGIADGLLLLASYSSVKLDDKIRLCSVYGNLDTSLGLENYKEYKKNWPSYVNEVIIEGGNHSQFADCGLIREDSDASISMEEQLDKTAEAVLESFE